MRRLVVALVLVIVAVSLTACGGSGGGSGTPAAGTPVSAASTASASSQAAGPPADDTLSGTQTVLPYESFPNDPAGTPAVIKKDLADHQPMIMFWYDPTTKVTVDQRAEINAVMHKYTGLIDLVAIDYTKAIAPNGDASQVPSETAKFALITAQLRVPTTPYVLLIDRAGRITYRFAGFVDRTLLEREVLRATQ
jgi:hypothetical protein